MLTPKVILDFKTDGIYMHVNCKVYCSKLPAYNNYASGDKSIKETSYTYYSTVIRREP